MVCSFKTKCRKNYVYSPIVKNNVFFPIMLQSRRNLKSCQEVTFASFANLIEAQSSLIKSSFIIRVQITILNDFLDLNSLNLRWLCPHWSHTSFSLFTVLKSANRPMFSTALQGDSRKTMISSSFFSGQENQRVLNLRSVFQITQMLDTSGKS